MKAGSRAGASENPLLLYQPGLSLTRRQEAEQIKQVPWLAKTAVIDLVAEAVETAAARGTTAGHPWARGIATLEHCGRPHWGTLRTGLDQPGEINLLRRM